MLIAIANSLEPSPVVRTDIDRALADLASGKRRFAATSAAARAELAARCLAGVVQAAPEWVDAACRAKRIPANSPLRAEEIAAGPLAVIRYLRLIVRTLTEIGGQGRPSLPGRVVVDAGGRVRVPLIPARGLYDPLLFRGYQGYGLMDKGLAAPDVGGCLAPRYGAAPARVVAVLSAGNVTSIPAVDAFGKLFQEGAVVLLKMSPVNDYLKPIFERAFAPLISAGYLRIVSGSAAEGAYSVRHELTDAVHLTGSRATHDRIVWGEPGDEQLHRRRLGMPLLDKPISSELGNVSPWIIAPGAYAPRHLAFQAENVAASVINNASFNCAATKVLVTWRRWPDRKKFLAQVQSIFARTPPRHAWYPGARERFVRFSGVEPGGPDGTLPWLLLEDVAPRESRRFFEEESFASVFVEVALDAPNEAAFLHRATDFVNEELWGTLCAAVTLPPGFRRRPDTARAWSACLGQLNYGSVAINHWPGLIYALMAFPWGGHPGGTLESPHSGCGWGHNTYLLDHVEKAVLEGPLDIWPKPLWFPTHRHPEPLAWKIVDLYARPNAWNLSRVLQQGLHA